MTTLFTTWGAVTALVLAVILILRKVSPVYALILAACVGGLVSGITPVQTVDAMVAGAKGMMPPVLRILASGVLAGALIRTGAATCIAEAVVKLLGSHLALAAIALATMIVCAVGVFIDVAVITVAPVALAVAQRVRLPVSAFLLSMVGGGKAGNVISPNPNTIATADAFKVDLTALIWENAFPALVGLLTTILLSVVMAKMLRKREDKTDVVGEASSLSLSEHVQTRADSLPVLWAAVVGPVVVVVLLALRPLCDIKIDPLIALPCGGIVTILVTGHARDMLSFSEFGLSKVTGVAILLVGTGTLAGVVKASALNADVIVLLDACHLPAWALAPISGILMAGATASTTAGATVAAQTFSATLLAAGVPALAASAMIHAGATVIDSLPHGSFFHATGGAVFMSIRQRLKLIPWEATVGLSTTLAAVVHHCI